MDVSTGNNMRQRVMLWSVGGFIDVQFSIAAPGDKTSTGSTVRPCDRGMGKGRDLDGLDGGGRELYSTDTDTYRHRHRHRH